MSEGVLDIRMFQLGPLGTNGFLLAAPASDSCVIVDPGGDPDPLLLVMDEKGWTPTTLLLTHNHFDHIGGVDALLEVFPGMDYAAHPLCAELVQNTERNLSMFFGAPGGITCTPPIRALQNGETIRTAGLDIRTEYMPGHSPDHVVFHIENYNTLIAGDTLFAGSIGRTDFPDSDLEVFMAGLRRMVDTCAPEVVVYPGHGSATTIGREKDSNPFL